MRLILAICVKVFVILTIMISSEPIRCCHVLLWVVRVTRAGVLELRVIGVIGFIQIRICRSVCVAKRIVVLISAEGLIVV